MPEIVLSTLNARFAHASLGLRYLLANLGPELRGRAVLREFTIKDEPAVIRDAILAERPRIVGLGVYIWNVAQTTELVRSLKKACPELCIVLGGPEVSHETEGQEIVALADFVVCGEGEVSFRELCSKLLSGTVPDRKIIPGKLPSTAALELPYRLYSDPDLRHRVVYVEASRGCPFKCEFCLSSLDEKVRDIPLERFLSEMEILLERGVQRFKFIDRTFNLKVQTSTAILEFFLKRHRPGLFLHFELVPDRLPGAVRALVAQFPPGSIQFEVGIQSFNEEVSRRISRRQDNDRVEENLRFLREETGIHVHADLIVGLPGENMESFASGFNRLLAMEPQEIQVGILKRLRGTPIVRHDREWQMVYSQVAPYEVLSTRDLDEETLRRLRRFAKYWDLFHNSGNFRSSLRLLLRSNFSPFDAFLRFSDWVFKQTGRTHSLALEQRVELLLRYLEDRGFASDVVGPVILQDYLTSARRRVPLVLKRFASPQRPSDRPAGSQLPARQSRHLQGRVTP